MSPKIYFKTYGCSVNQSESEVMKGFLAKEGYEIVDDMEKSELIIHNICTVKGEVKALRELRKIIRNRKNRHKRLVIAGCIPSSHYELLKKEFNCSLIDTHNIKNIVKVVKNTLQGKVVYALGKNKNNIKNIKICLPKLRKNPIISIIPVSSGCNMACSYCSVKLIKGQLISYPEKLIINEAKNSIAEGCKEIWITAQDTAAYGLENNKKSQLGKLVKKIANIDGDFMTRIGMMNPRNFLTNPEEITDSMKDKKVFRFFHMPVQSGNDEILKKMNRKYKATDFKKIIKKIRKEIKNITISTDIICGFPEETEEQFKDSLRLIKEIKPDVLNISRFISRPGTVSENMKHILSRTAKERTRKLTKAFKEIALEKNKAWIGWKGNIIIDETGKKGTNTFVGRNYAYRPVIVSDKDKAGKKYKLGQKVKVKIRKVTEHYLVA